MTPLNTIIEEEKNKYRCDCEDQPCHVVNITVDEFTTAMQRAYEAGKKEADAKWEREKELIMHTLDNWSDFTCHSRDEHKTNDCPGWSHEDQAIRKILLSQVRYTLDTLLSKITRTNP